MKNQNLILLHFGLVVKNLRLEQKFSQEELAHRSGLHRTYITDVEHGSRNISLESISKIANALSISISDLFSMINRYSASAAGVPSVSAATEKKLEPVEIILIEDEMHRDAMLAHALRGWSVANPVRLFGSERETMEFFFSGTTQKAHPANGQQLLIIDLQHTKINSINILEKIRSENYTRKIPVVVVASSSDSKKLEQCKKIGVQGYLTRPIGFSDFSTMLPQIGFQWLLSGEK